MEQCVYCEKEIKNGVACDECCFHIGNSQYVDILKAVNADLKGAIATAVDDCKRVSIELERIKKDNRERVTHAIRLLENLDPPGGPNGEFWEEMVDDALKVLKQAEEALR